MFTWYSNEFLLSKNFHWIRWRDTTSDQLLVQEKEEKSLDVDLVETKLGGFDPTDEQDRTS
jgi:hypothetical protein